MLLISSPPEAEEKAFASSDCVHSDMAIDPDARRFFAFYLHEEVFYSVTPLKGKDVIVFRWRKPPTIKEKHRAH